MIAKAANSNQPPAISSQLSAASSQQKLQHRNIEDLKGRKDPEALNAAVKELEALFAYEMIKAMRETTESTKGGFGKDAYMSLFDTELSRIFADRGLGLKDVLLGGLSRQAAKGNQPSAVTGQPTVVSPERSAASGQEKKAELTPDPQSLLSNPQPPISASGEPNIPVDGVVSSKFGMRKHPLHGDSRFHKGMDIAAPEGTDVYPYMRGKVIFSGEQSGYGNTVVIDHGNGYITKYAHNRINLVKAGDLVDENAIIAEVGSSGLSTGPHLHFEVRKDGKYLNPAAVLALK